MPLETIADRSQTEHCACCADISIMKILAPERIKVLYHLTFEQYRQMYGK